MKEGIKCKWCNKKGVVSFGWIDSEAVWHSKHLTCRKHAELSVSQQQLECNMETMRERSKLFNRPRPVELFSILNP